MKMPNCIDCGNPLEPKRNMAKRCLSCGYKHDLTRNEKVEPDHRDPHLVYALMVLDDTVPMDGCGSQHDKKLARLLKITGIV